MNPAGLREQLIVPDQVGRNLALFRARVYRFSSDLRWYVLAEALEEGYLAGKQPRQSTMDAVRAGLASIRVDGSLPAFPNSAAAAEDVDIEASLDLRTPYSLQRLISGAQPVRIMIIVGAPRSGTSHLFNLLAATGRFAYFTTASCWAWPVRNLHQAKRRLFTTLDKGMVRAADNKKTRIIPGLVMPGEAEDTWHRAMPVYHHIRGHRYDISQQSGEGNPCILDAAASAHQAHFGRDALLVKSPFNSFRIPQIEQHWGNGVRYVHIIRDQHETADSMRRNHFEFESNRRPLDAEDAWKLFVGTIEASAPVDRTVTVRHADMLRDPTGVLGTLTHQFMEGELVLLPHLRGPGPH